MLKIAICDGDKYFANKMKEIVSGYINKLHMLYEIDIFSSGKEFLELGIEVVKYKIVFLDINMNGLNGIETAKLIHEASEKIYIVFVTENVNYILEGYKVDAIRYLLKGTEKFIDSMYECLDAILYKMNYAVEEKEIQFHECKKIVHINHLLYIESRLHKLKYHIMEDELCIYTQYGKLDNLENEYKRCGFIRIHQSFLVNMEQIKSVERFEVLLSNGIELVVPKARYKYVKESFAAYNKKI